MDTNRDSVHKHEWYRNEHHKLNIHGGSTNSAVIQTSTSIHGRSTSRQLHRYNKKDIVASLDTHPKCTHTNGLAFVKRWVQHISIASRTYHRPTTIHTDVDPQHTFLQTLTSLRISISDTSYIRKTGRWGGWYDEVNEAVE